MSPLLLFALIIHSALAARDPGIGKTVPLAFKKMTVFATVDILSKTTVPDAALRRVADAMLTSRQMFSITWAPKSEMPPSGDMRDYLSRALYWWPNPTCPRCPWIRIDGKRQPDTFAKLSVTSICIYSTVLSMAAVKFPEKRSEYIQRSRAILFTFFANETTKIHPNGRFSQIIGKNSTSGNVYGIVDFRRFAMVVNSVLLLREIGGTNASIDISMTRWFSSLLAWLETSDLGVKAKATVNNHRTWYTFTCITLALGVSNIKKASSIYTEFVQSGVIQRQIKLDGSQPLEDNRANATTYRIFNLNGIFSLIDLGLKYNLSSERIEEIGNKRPLAAARSIAKNPIDNAQVCSNFYEAYYVMRMAIQVYKLNVTGDPQIFTFARKARQCGMKTVNNANWIGIEDLAFLRPFQFLV